MDEEASFSALLSSTTKPSRPSWDAPVNSSDDPWANPFSDSTTTTIPVPTLDPYTSSSSLSFTPGHLDTAIPTFSDIPDISNEEVSPYVQKIHQDAEEAAAVAIVTQVDPPSVIAAREQEQQGFEEPHGVYASSSFNTPLPTISNTNHDSNPFDNTISNSGLYNPPPPVDPAQQPFIQHRHEQIEPSQPENDSSKVDTIIPTTKGRMLPSALIDEDLMAESDPEQSLKKAFVKSTPTQRKPAAPASGATNGDKTPEKKSYIFTPTSNKQPKPNGKEQTDQKVEDSDKADDIQPKEEESTKESADSKANTSEPEVEEQKEGEDPEGKPSAESTPRKETVPPIVEERGATPTAPSSPTSIPLPTSSSATPTISRVPTPLPPRPDATDSSSVLATPSSDRVSVSPLDAPSVPAEEDYGFKSLSIGGSAMTSTPTPAAPPVPEKEWSSSASNSDITSPPSSRFGGKGWGVLDDQDETQEGLFGKGGPASSVTPWSVNDTSSGWGETSMEDVLASSAAIAGPSRSFSDTNGSSSLTSPIRTTFYGSDRDEPESPNESMSNSNSNVTPTTSPRKKLSSLPVFQITVSDPTKVGDPVRGYTVYTVRTQTTSPHYRKGSFSVLRRFSDFLWLIEILTFNNPGIIIPPMPGKHTFGRFQDQFIETRRSALERCLSKVTNHPVLQLDPDLRTFLESDSFAFDSKNRKNEVIAIEKQSASLLNVGGWTGPKFIEQDDWFESRKSFLDSLENQLKSLSKSIETSSKQRLDLSSSINEFGESIIALSESDLGASLSSALSQLANITEREKEHFEDQAKDEVVTLLNMADEYIRFIQSVRIAFAGRIKSWNQWQSGEKDVTRLKSQREKLRSTGKLGDRANQTLAEIAEAERTARELHSTFEHLSRLTKSEFVRFERERVEEFKSTLEKYLNGMIEKQKELIELWEAFHKLLAGLVEKSSSSNSKNQNNGD
ncbi:uncharacterized protein IL334_004909 [Kwoniella shivajii]|uniref:PX domain-containing protein n=1 Tax=Kwoniella shivajii TaxID=564305 RepID=A0ABZ1D210_9TREE|nr:hypothetical protein IL334_004909 [Kwoniella shivajii]